MTAKVWAIVPAAGAGKRMQADRPKQYLPLAGKTVIQHTLEKLAAVPEVNGIVVALDTDDSYWPDLQIKLEKPCRIAAGGKERVDSVFNAVQSVIDELDDDDWLLVHDAARPCVTVDDIRKLLREISDHPCGGILATPVTDTMKQANPELGVETTIDRSQLWHALTPQCFRAATLYQALEHGVKNPAAITDESSAIEAINKTPLLVQGRADNLKITRPEDLALAEFYLSKDEDC